MENNQLKKNFRFFKDLKKLTEFYLKMLEFFFYKKRTEFRKKISSLIFMFSFLKLLFLLREIPP